MEWSKSVHIISKQTGESSSAALLSETTGNLDVVEPIANTEAAFDEGGIRKHLKRLELEVDEMMLQFEGMIYGKLPSTAASKLELYEQLTTHMVEIKDLVAKLQAQKITNPAILRGHQLRLQIYNAEARKIKAKIIESREVIISKKRNDSTTLNLLLEEGKSLDRSNSILDEITVQSDTTHRELRSQHEHLQAQETKLHELIDSLLGTGNFLTKITKHQYRQAIALTLLIALCIIVLLYYALRKR